VVEWVRLHQTSLMKFRQQFDLEDAGPQFSGQLPFGKLRAGSHRGFAPDSE
jgi:hypothetical protein